MERAQRLDAFIQDIPTGTIIQSMSGRSRGKDLGISRKQKMEEAAQQEDGKTKSPERDGEDAVQRLKEFMDQATDKNIVQGAKQAWGDKDVR
jgi:hypothetical protein